MVNVLLKISYNGAAFCGFARQPKTLTVQGNIEEALRLLFKREVLSVCAGRTDAGVHAREQYISFELEDEEFNKRSVREFIKSLNALTHDDIHVHSCVEVPLGFSARFDARLREYRYFLCLEETPSLFLNDFSWHVGPQLNIDAMRNASVCLIGEHDFKSFCLAASAKDKRTIRTVTKISLDEVSILDERFLQITICGNAFLHSMIRTIVGSLVLIGKGHRDEVWLKRALDACDRCAAGQTAPAKGLVFWHVSYDGEVLYSPDKNAEHTLRV